MRYSNTSEIIARLIDRTQINSHDLNDFSTSSVIGSIYQSFAMELDQYGVLHKQNIKKGIEQGIYEAFGFERLEARRAYGELILGFHTAPRHDVVIPRGTTFYSNQQGKNQVYETLEEYVVGAGSNQAVITVYCTERGSIGNIGQGLINSHSNSIHNVSSISNPYAFLTGQDREPIEQVKGRFREYIETRGRATVRSIRFGVLEVDDIVGVYVHNQTGKITVYAHDMNGNLPDDLRLLVERATENYRPAGIFTEVKAIEKINLDVNVKVTLTDKTARSESFRQEIEDAIVHFLNSFTVNEDLILSELVQRVMNIDDYLIYDIEITNRDTNRLVEPHQLIRAGSVTVELV